jgi:hypothetical protein
MNKTGHLAVSLFFFLIFYPANLYPQKMEDIVTDRPDQTESAGIVPKGFVQIEAGVSGERAWKIDFNSPIGSGTSELYNYEYPALLFRFGLEKGAELRFGLSYLGDVFSQQYSYESEPSFEETRRGMSSFTIGAKFKLFEEKKALPETAFLIHVSVPFSGNRIFQPEYIGTDFRFAMAHSLSRRFSLSYNLGGEWDGDSPQATGIYTLSLGISLINNLSMFVESYGFLTQKQSPDHRIDGGFTYLFLPNLQADISGGLGITDKSPDYFIGAGLSVRLPH